MRNFFVAALPRSRTAWCAAFFSASYGQFCYHEGLRKCKTPRDFLRKMQIGGYDFVGNSDCGLALTYFQDIWPDAPTLKIWRPFKDVNESLNRLGMDVDWDMVLKIDELMNNITGMDVDYSELDARMPQICTYLGLQYNEQKHELFTQLNIQTTDFTPDQEALAAWNIRQ